MIFVLLHVLRDFIGRFVVVYFDDILVDSRSLDDYLGYLRQVLSVLRKNTLCQYREVYLLYR